MAQANSVQREPSMEEILASIRRIIEDSDTGRPPLGENDQSAAAPEVEPEMQAAIELEAFREELQPAAEDEREQPVSLAQIQAEMAQEPRAEAVAGESWPQPEAPAHEPAAAEREDEPEPVQNGAMNGAHFAAADEAHQQVQAENQNPRPAILSEQAGRQVAASFGELSEAFAASRRKSFDEMAEEMMRPMLQDWLDNNLPLLVERLVREEIERVARGGAR